MRPDDLDGSVLSSALRRAAPPACQHAGLFVEEGVRIGLRYADSRVADVTYNHVRGASVRWVTAQDVRYRSTDVVDVDDILHLLGQAGPTPLSDWRRDGAHGRPRPAVGDNGAKEQHDDTIGRLAHLAAAVDAAARDVDDRITRVLIDVEHHSQSVCAVTLEGGSTDNRHLLYLTVRAVARSGERIASSYYTPATSDPDGVLDPVAIGREAAKRALQSLVARPAPIRHMPIVVGPGRGMVLIHEACCHPLEGDEVLRGSVYAGRLGTRIAAEHVSIDDDSLVPGAVGTYRIDDEGVPGRRTALVTDGVLRSYLTDRLSAARLGVAPSGNGRRDGYQSMPLPRMSNTCVHPGPHSPESIIADTKFGLYAEHVGGGEVVESTGDFVFRVTNGYLIENGRLTDPIQETTVSGNGAAVLNDIDAVGNDVQVGAAKCGKYGQFLPVGVVGPTLRIRSLLVGGTEQ